MKALKVVFTLLVLLLVATGVAFYLIGKSTPQPAGISIETNIRASVFIDGSLVGETPFKSSYKAGKKLLRLVPEGSSENLVSYETQISLTSGTETVISRDFATTEEGSSGYVISFNKIKSGTELSISTVPNNIQVVVDGVSRGFSPFTTSDIAPAEHVVEIKAPGYQNFTKNIRTETGYSLMVFVKLEKASEALPQVSSDLNGKKVTIVGGLKVLIPVNSEPGGNGEKIAIVSSGQNFPYVDTDVATGWIGINYQASSSGNLSSVMGWIEPKFASVSSNVN